jgi:hypothetical protein
MSWIIVTKCRELADPRVCIAQGDEHGVIGVQAMQPGSSSSVQCNHTGPHAGCEVPQSAATPTHSRHPTTSGRPQFLSNLFVFL